MKILLLFALCFISFVAVAHFLYRSGDPQKAASQFDFWVGEWDLSWSDSMHGTNVVTREMNGFVISEHFNSPADHFMGWSWSVYDTLAKTWKQTWVDNQGAYLDFTGGMQGDKMILERSVMKAGKLIKQRMIFYNITNNNFDWNWESSVDGGNLWKTNWKIHYKRKR